MSSRKALWIVLAFAFFARFAAGFSLQSYLDRSGAPGFLFYDSDGYWQLGQPLDRID